MHTSWESRRSPVYSPNGAAATSQPLATESAVRILRLGGTAADAAVAAAAVLAVTQPCSTGLGGDCCALWFDGGQKRVEGMVAFGASAKCHEGDAVRAAVGQTEDLPARSPWACTVPGAASGWMATLDRWGGGVSRAEVLRDAIALCRDGFALGPVTQRWWQDGFDAAVDGSRRPGWPAGSVEAFVAEFGVDGRAPRLGERLRRPDFGAVLERLCEHGAEGFYRGPVGDAIVAAMQERGVPWTADDLELQLERGAEFVEPLRVPYRDTVDVWELPPSGQGIVALMGLGVLDRVADAGGPPRSAGRLHHQVDALRLAFADASWYVADPRRVDVPMHDLISPEYCARRHAMLQADRALPAGVPRGFPKQQGGDTVYLSVVDRTGNACSFINSNYMGFGSSVVPTGCGFTMQNRGACFRLDDGHPNCVAPDKRAYHTIIPGMTTVRATGELHACFGVMGGFMQPQGHLQVVSALVDDEMNPQQAIDAPRFCLTGSSGLGELVVEPGLEQAAVELHDRMGHEKVRTEPVLGQDRSVFGNGQIIQRDPHTGIVVAGSDPRCDGMAMGY